MDLQILDECELGSSPGQRLFKYAWDSRAIRKEGQSYYAETCSRC